MGEAQQAAGQAPVATEVTARRFRVASPVTALVLGGLVLVLMAADVPLALWVPRCVLNARRT
jgi:hypothetical protein